jgi:hypothetical protein
MHKDLPTLKPRTFDPIADRSQLRFQRVNPVITHTLDVQHLDPPLSRLDPQ